MKRRISSILFVVVAAGLPLSGEGSKQLVQVTNTEQVAFQPGGTIHLNRSFGDLSVEGWDRPEVEITVIKTLDLLYTAKEQAESDRRLQNVQVKAERRSDTDLEITTTARSRSRLAHPFGPTLGVKVEYRIHAPRNSKLVIHHGTGDVIVSYVKSDIEATGHAGDIVLLLPESGQYSIDAKSKIGTVSSDFDGDSQRRGLAGTSYAHTTTTPAYRIYLRMGLGGITIKQSPRSAEPPLETEGQ
jgi:hypothetical protein